MLGGKSGLINEGVNQHTNEQLTEAIKYMSTKEYQDSRDTTDVIPTHKRKAATKPVLDSHLQVHTNEKKLNLDDFRSGESGAATGEGDDDEEDDDEELEALRKARAGTIKKQSEKMAEWNAKGHGVYREIPQDDFFGAVVREKGGSDLVVVHFFHRDFTRCQVITKHLSDLAPQMLPIKFVGINVEKAPFLVEKLRVTVLPCCVLFVNDVAVDRIVGFEGLQVNEKGDDIEQESLKYKIEVGLKLREEDE